MKSKFLQIFLGALAGAMLVLAVLLPLYLLKDTNSGDVQEAEFIYLGEYPQSLAENNITFSDEAEEDGYFLGSDGQRYARVDTTEQNGEQVVSVCKYFKVEKLKWRVLSKKDGFATVVCDSIIDNVAFQPYRTTMLPSYINLNDTKIDEDFKEYLQNELGMKTEDKIFLNDYEHSYVRFFLNKIFYQNAFSDAERARIAATTIDNSAASTLKSDSKYFCEETTDFVFLLSCQDVVSKKFGFSPSHEFDDNKAFPVSDYAQQIGAETITQKDIAYALKDLLFSNAALFQKFLGTGRAMLRSASFSQSNQVATLYRGTIVHGCTAYAKQGIAPSMRVKL